jgi:hypothetical protein
MTIDWLPMPIPHEQERRRSRESALHRLPPAVRKSRGAVALPTRAGGERRASTRNRPPPDDRRGCRDCGQDTFLTVDDLRWMI